MTPADQISVKSGFEIWRDSDSNPNTIVIFGFF